MRDEYRAADTYRIVETNAKLWKSGDAALLAMPYLGVALTWREHQRPNSAWAARYGDAFSLAIEFLDRSERADKEAIELREATRRRAAVLSRAVAIAMAALALLAVGLAFFAFENAHVAQSNAAAAIAARNEAEQSAQQAYASAAAATASKNEADAAKAMTLQAQLLSNAERDKAQQAQSRFLARDANTLTNDGNSGNAIQVALAALPKDLEHPDRPFVKDAEYALANAFVNLRERLELAGRVMALRFPRHSRRTAPTS